MKKTKMLKKNYEYKFVLSKGKYISGNYLEAFVKETNNKNENLLGIAVSVKVGKAIKRNLIKRRIRESYKNHEKDLNTGYNIVFLWKKKIDIKEATYENISKDMYKIFDKANMLNEVNR